MKYLLILFLTVSFSLSAQTERKYDVRDSNYKIIKTDLNPKQLYIYLYENRYKDHIINYREWNGVLQEFQDFECYHSAELKTA